MPFLPNLKLWLYLGTVLVALSGWVYGGLQKAARASDKAEVIATQQETLRIALRAAEASAMRSRELSKKRLIVALQQRRAAELQLIRLHNAFKDNPEWASAPVPDSVWDALGVPRPAGPSPAR